MCQHCRSNSARYIAGHGVRQYRDSFLNGEEWRLKLCTNLQAILLLNLCDHKITPETMIRHDKDLRNYLWSRSGLDFRYDHNFGSVLRMNLNLTPIPLNLGSPPGSQQLGPVQLQATPGAQLDPQHQLPSHQVVMSQPRPMTGRSAPLGLVPQAASQSTQPNSPIQAFGQAGYLNHPAQQSVHSTINGFAVQAEQPATGSVSQPVLQSTQSAQHVALQEPTSDGEATPLVMQLLTHHRRQQSGQQQASSISPSGGLLPTDYYRTLNTLPLTGSAQPASVTTPTKKARPNFHFGLSPLPVPPEALRQPQETVQTATVMADINSGYTNYREPTVDDEMDEMDMT
ncbi:hypothetical protein B0J15DRAFT_577359 [Fusarium solani]|uniref:Uncharacterized protein n=1 Tax=Fusarium solani TaxID=169388 RepID=A0A9P9JM76_FUSSL|nr:uncharacterized protein B0J15DRAFT_577359 [Fusarium solani]KAH7228640.1 hypothetical protein B0J15DRAFT_577359 [Fusarium solani]